MGSEIAHSDGAPAHWRVVEHFGLAWPPQAVHIDLHEPGGQQGQPPAKPLCVVDQTGHTTVAQVIQQGDRATLWYVASLKPYETREYRLVHGDAAPDTAVTFKIGPDAAEWRGPNFGLRLAWASDWARPDPSEPISQWPGPIRAVCGPDGIWFGQGSWQGTAHCKALRCEVIDAGPVIWRLRQAHVLEDGTELTLLYRLDAATPAVEVTQQYSGPATDASLV
ncbi:MAG: hypothetical protein M1546_14025, partial [Chloroflexi bacterium]|nr:hypothetical protein [Chloroflexota bacterium]